MALENYTKGQKVFMVTLVVALAALFTVTGSMIAIIGDQGGAAPPDKGTIDGEAVRLIEHQRKLRALGITTFADLAAASPDRLMEQLKGSQPLSKGRVRHWTEAARERARS